MANLFDDIGGPPASGLPLAAALPAPGALAPKNLFDDIGATAKPATGGEVAPRGVLPPLPAPAAAGPASPPPPAAGNLFGDIGTPTPSPPPDDGILAHLRAGWDRGMVNLGENFNLALPVLKYQVGLGSANEVATAAAPIMAKQAEYEKTLPPEASGWTWNHVAEALGGLVPSAGAVVTSGLLGGTVGSLAGGVGGSAIEPGVGTVAGAGVGGTVGTVTGLASSGAITTNATAFFDYLRIKGIDVTNPVATEAALTADPELAQQAKFYAAKRSGINAALNAIGFGVGGKITDAGLSFAGKLGAETATGGALMAGGELANQALAGDPRANGQIDWDAVAQQGVFGALSGAAPVAVGASKMYAGRAVTAIAKSLSDDPLPPTSIFDPLTNNVGPNPAAGPNPWANHSEWLAGQTILTKIQELHEALAATKPQGNQAFQSLATWRQQLIPAVPSAVWTDTQVGRNFLDALDTLDPSKYQKMGKTSLLRQTELMQELAGVRTMYEEVPTNNANLMPIIRVTNFGTKLHNNPFADVTISNGQGVTQDSKNVLIVTGLSRELSSSEVNTIQRYARDHGYDRVAWRDDLLDSTLNKHTPMDIDVSFGTQENLKTVKVDPERGHQYWLPISADREPPAGPGAGHVRLYRGETAGGGDAAVPEWLKGTPEHQATVNATGRWFSDNYSAARHYVDHFGQPGSHVTYVDVPAADAERYRVSNQLEIARHSAAGRAGEEYFVPREVANQRQVHPGGANEHILGSAVTVDGRVFKGRTHVQAIEAAASATGRSIDDIIEKTPQEDLAQFHTNEGRLVDRKAAYDIAKAHDQVDEARRPRWSDPSLNVPEGHLTGEMVREKRPVGEADIAQSPADSAAGWTSAGGPTPGGQPVIRRLGDTLSDADRTSLLKRLQLVVAKIAKELKLSKPLLFEDKDLEGNQGMAIDLNGKYTIQTDSRIARTGGMLFKTMTHELGHIVWADKIAKAHPETLMGILDAYQRWRDEQVRRNVAGAGIEQMGMGRATAMEYLAVKGNAPVPTGLFAPTRENVYYHNYWNSLSEWAAQEAAKWASTGLRPLSIVDKYFSGFAKLMLRVLSRVYRNVGLEFNPSREMGDFYDALMHQVNPGVFRNVYEKVALASLHANKEMLAHIGAPEVVPVQPTPATDMSRGIVHRFLKVGTVEGGRWKQLPDSEGVVRNYKGLNQEAAAARSYGGLASIGDIVRGFFSYTLGIHQLALRNLDVAELSKYKGGIQSAALDVINAIQDPMAKVIRPWRRLSGDMQAKVLKAWGDMDRMVYRTSDEAMKEVSRPPTAAERDAITRGLNPDGKKIFEAYFETLDKHLEDWLNVLREDAAKPGMGNTLAVQARRLAEIDALAKNLRQSPYVPHARFGRLTYTIRDKRTDKPVLFAMTESSAEREALVKKYKDGMIYPDTLYDHIRGVLAKDAYPFVSIQPNMLKHLEAKLGDSLSSTQRAAIQDLQYQLSPAQSHIHRWQRRDDVPGYSKDFMRAYADYFLHGANYIARARYKDMLQDQIKELTMQAKFMPHGDRLGDIRNSMSDHFANWLDPKPDFWRYKAAAFFIYLGYNVKSALVNLTQIPMQTYPYLAAHFGDYAALSALSRNGTKLSTYWQRGNVDMQSSFRMRLIDYLTKSGTLTEALAPDLAGTADGRNMTEKYLGNTAQRSVSWFMHHSGTMFQWAEQANRSITATAAGELALLHPEAKGITDAIKANPDFFISLMNQGVSAIEARAITYAKQSVESTQGVYARWARPKMFQGKLGTLFMFKNYQQQFLFMLMNYPQTIARSMLVTAFLGGAAGLPFFQDAEDLIKTIAYKVFGKDFDIEREARQFLIQTSDGTIPPDLLLHGVSRYGMGIPALMDLVSHTANLGDVPFPTFDISSSVGFGATNPMPLYPLFGPIKDPNLAIGNAAQQMSGAAYSLGFALFKLLEDPGNTKAWSAIIPRAAYNVVRAHSAFTDNFTNNAGARIVRFDPSDTEEMSEAAAMSLGFNPQRLTSEWDRERAIQEVQTFWQVRRENLLHQFDDAIVRRDQDDKARVLNAIRTFNRTVPVDETLQRITAATLQASAQQRVKANALLEKQLPLNKQTSQIVRNINELYPESLHGKIVAARRVAPGTIDFGPLGGTSGAGAP